MKELQGCLVQRQGFCLSSCKTPPPKCHCNSCPILCSEQLQAYLSPPQPVDWFFEEGALVLEFLEPRWALGSRKLGQSWCPRTGLHQVLSGGQSHTEWLPESGQSPVRPLPARSACGQGKNRAWLERGAHIRDTNCVRNQEL